MAVLAANTIFFKMFLKTPWMSPIQLKITTLIVHFNFKTAMSVLFDYSDGSRISREGFNLKQWRIQDFPGGEGAPTPKVGVLTFFLAENCMEMKEIVPPEEGGARLWCTPWIRQCLRWGHMPIISAIFPPNCIKFKTMDRGRRGACIRSASLDPRLHRYHQSNQSRTSQGTNLLFGKNSMNMKKY